MLRNRWPNSADCAPKEIDHITENDLRKVAVKMDWEEQQRKWEKLLSKTSKKKIMHNHPLAKLDKNGRIYW
jgi:hypothetical protein